MPRVHPFPIRSQQASYPPKTGKRAKTAKPRPRLVLTVVQDTCVLCGGTIRRMDRDVYVETMRCAPCHEALDA